MKVTFLGTGTSQGVPVIGCDCSACKSENPKDDRLRSGLLVEKGPTNILVDTSPDLRMQMLRAQVEHVDAVLYTHEHNDHVIGLDDIRPFNFKQRKDMPLYGLPRVMEEVKSRFAYIFSARPYPGAPRGVLHEIKGISPIIIEGVEVCPIPIMHGSLPILGYRFGELTFITDASFISDSSMKLITGSKYLIINALQREEHRSHFNLEQALDVIRQIGPKQAFLTHVSHHFGPVASWETKLPDNVAVAYDGLEIHM